MTEQEKGSGDNSELEIYIPDFNLQGEGFPFYITSRHRLKRVKISFDSGVKLKAVYNAIPEKIQVGESDLIIDGFQTDGYLGGAFEGTFDDSQFGKMENITFEVMLENNKSAVRKRINLFRPDLRVLSVPDSINIKFGSKKNVKSDSFSLLQKVVLYNAGEGTAVASIKQGDDSDLELTLPKDIQEVMENIVRDWDSAIEELSGRYPKYSKSIQGFSQMLKEPIPTKENAEIYKVTMGELDKHLETDEAFKDDFIETFIGAILKNYSVSKDLRQFLGYLLSVKPKKVILMNPFVRVKIPEGVSYLDIIITVTDLSRNPYDDISLGKIRIESPQEVEVPFMDMFDFVSKEES